MFNEHLFVAYIFIATFGSELSLLFMARIFGHLICVKIVEAVATIGLCQILGLKCTKFNFGWGSAPDPAGGAYSAPPDPLAGFKGPTSKERGSGWERRKVGREEWERS